MIYLFETYYLDKINFTNAIKVSALYCAKICEFFEAEILMPKKGFLNKTIKKGQLDKQNDKFIFEIVDWLLSNSANSELFKLFIYNNPINASEPRIFDHHDDTCCWAINLSQEQFIELQSELKENKLPEDLFFESTKSVCVKSKGIMGFLGFNKCYTPKEYEATKNKTRI